MAPQSEHQKAITTPTTTITVQPENLFSPIICEIISPIQLNPVTGIVWEHNSIRFFPFLLSISYFFFLLSCFEKRREGDRQRDLLYSMVAKHFTALLVLLLLSDGLPSPRSVTLQLLMVFSLSFFCRFVAFLWVFNNFWRRQRCQQYSGFGKLNQNWNSHILEHSMDGALLLPRLMFMWITICVCTCMNVCRCACMPASVRCFEKQLLTPKIDLNKPQRKPFYMFEYLCHGWV